MSKTPISYSEFVGLILDALEAAGIEYLVGGALAAWAWGEPRTTMDLDVVVDIPVEAVAQFSRELEKRDMLVPPDIILDAMIEERADLPINAIHMYSGFKADIYPLRPRDELRRSALDRRQLVDYGPPLGKIYIHSPEDLVLYKVWYYSLSEQTKHIRDVAAIRKALGDQIDMEYIRFWLEKKGLTSAWTAMLNAIDL